MEICWDGRDDYVIITLRRFRFNEIFIVKCNAIESMLAKSNLIDLDVGTINTSDYRSPTT